MNYSNLFIFAILALLGLLVPVILLVFSFNTVVFNENFYKNEFLKYKVYAHLTDYDVEKINNGVLFYLKGQKNNELIASSFFNNREKQHLLDVKGLIAKLLFVYKFSIFLFFLLFLGLCFLFNFKFRKILEKFLLSLFFGSLLLLTVGISLFFLWNSDFYFIFDAFHENFFKAGTFSFDPNFEKIVVLYQENLFFDTLSKILLKSILSSAIISLLVFSAFPKIFGVGIFKIISKNFRRKA